MARLLGADALIQGIALLLLAMSVATWVAIVWKAWQLPRAQRGVAEAIAAFWQAPTLADAASRMPLFDRGQLVAPLVAAVTAAAAPGGTLGAAGATAHQLTRSLRGALHQGLARLQYGQTLLATIGATAPFVGLLGTVWGIYHAMAGMAQAAPVTIDSVAGPVGEALVLTALGLAVAIPAVLAYNLAGRRIATIEADLEGFAHDLHAQWGGG